MESFSMHRISHLSFYHHSDKYDVNSNIQWLEECIDFETFISGDENAQQLDLLEPIKLK